MPAVRVFGRRTLIGGDDLQPGACATILVRVFQIVFLLTPLWIHVGLTVSKHGWSGFVHASAALSFIGSCDGDNDNDNNNSNSNHNNNNNNNSENDEERSKNGNHGDLFPIFLVSYLACSMLFCVGSIAVEGTLYRRSSVGTPTEPHLRLPTVSHLLEFKLVPMALFHGVVFGLGVATACMTRMYLLCKHQAGQGEEGAGGGGYNFHTPPFWWVCLVLLLSSQAAEVLLSTFSLCRIFMLKKHAPPPLKQPSPIFANTATTEHRETQLEQYILHLHHHTHYGPVEDMWDKRCRACCKLSSILTCFLFGGRNIDQGGDFAHIARVLADYFEDGGQLDVVPSDVAVGFVMLRRVQREREVEARRRILVGEEDEGEVEVGIVESGSGSGSSSGLYAGSNLTAETMGTPLEVPPPPSTTTVMAGALTPPRTKVMQRKGSGANLVLYPGTTTNHPQQTLAPDSEHTAKPKPKPKPTTNNNPDTTTNNNPDTNNEEEEDLTITNLHTPNSPKNPSSALTYRLQQSGARFYYDCIQRNVLSRDFDSDRYVMAEGARFVRHAVAIYSWMLYVYMHPVQAVGTLGCGCFVGRCGRLVKGGCCGAAGAGAGGGGTLQDNSAAALLVDETCCLNNTPGECSNPTRHNLNHNQNQNPNHTPYKRRIVGDNCWGVHEAALLQQAGLDSHDLVYARFDNGFDETPYCIVIDRKWQSVVVAIRGSLSLEDCVTDVLIDPEHLEGTGRLHGFEGRGEFCHSGVMTRVRWIYQDLERHGLLERLLLGESPECPNYTLRIVGHSLGAGCAVMLSIMLRQTYPTLRCLCYSPPGGLLSWNLATGLCKEFVTSFVLDTEIVPRLSVESMEHLRNEVLELILRIKVPKMNVARAAFVAPRFCGAEEDEQLTVANRAMLYSKEAAPWDTEFAQQLLAFRAIQQERKEHRGGAQVPLFPPGRIVHLVKTDELRTCGDGVMMCLSCGTSNAGSKYTPVWVNNDDFGEIIVSPTLWTDHFPNRVCLEMENVAEEFGLDTSLGSGCDMHVDNCPVMPEVLA